MPELLLPFDQSPGNPRFWEHHREHPEVWTVFERFTLEVVEAGATRIGARLIWERMRWHVRFEIKSKEPWSLNDHLVPYYARHFIEVHPEHAGLFEFRPLKESA